MMSRFAIITTSIKPRTVSMISVSLIPEAFESRWIELDDKMVNVDALRHDQTEVERRLKPAAQEDEAAEGFLGLAHFGWH